jgi:hypothetical protein
MNVFNTQYSNGQFTFDGSVTGLPLADFLLGRIGQLQQGSDVHLNERNNYFALYLLAEHHNMPGIASAATSS